MNPLLNDDAPLLEVEEDLSQLDADQHWATRAQRAEFKAERLELAMLQIAKEVAMFDGVSDWNNRHPSVKSIDRVLVSLGYREDPDGL